MTTYKLKFVGNREFIIISPQILQLLLADVRRSQEKELSVDMGQLIPDAYRDYLLNVINSNREESYFSYDYIQRKPVALAELLKITEKQLKQMNIGNAECFEEIQLLEKKGRWLELDCTDTFWIACKDTEALFLYRHSDGSEEIIKVET